jgi:hypothetical protein
MLGNLTLTYKHQAQELVQTMMKRINLGFLRIDDPNPPSSVADLENLNAKFDLENLNANPSSLSALHAHGLWNATVGPDGSALSVPGMKCVNPDPKNLRQNNQQDYWRDERILRLVRSCDLHISELWIALAKLRSTHQKSLKSKPDHQLQTLPLTLATSNFCRGPPRDPQPL